MPFWQLTVNGQTDTSPLAQNVFAFNVEDPQDAATALANFYTEIDDYISSDASFDVEPVARLYDPATGVLEDLSNVSWTAPIDGAAAGTRAADSTALLLAWNTGVVTGGSLIQGRTFIPYPSLTVTGEGHVTGVQLPNIQAAAEAGFAFLQAQHLSIWRRPVGGAGGVLAEVSQVTVRQEYGVQRRRRT